MRGRTKGWVEDTVGRSEGGQMMTRMKGSGNDSSAGNPEVLTARENARETEEGETDRAAGDSERVTGTGLKQ